MMSSGIKPRTTEERSGASSELHDRSSGHLSNSINDDLCDENENDSNNNNSNYDDYDDDDEEDDDDDDDNNLEVIQDYTIDPSISYTQTRLKSPTTPAAEKAAALDKSTGGFFDEPRSLEDEEDSSEPPVNYVILESSSSFGLDGSNVSKPKPPTSGNYVKTGENDESREEGAPHLRPRASTVVASTSQEPRKRRSTFVSFPFPKVSGQRITFPSVNTALSWFHGSETNQKDEQQDAERSDAAQKNPSAREYVAEITSPESLPYRSHELQRQGSAVVRRSTSHGTLRLDRSMSHASSLGDDSRWNDVHGQVNSRMKAIRDTFADSSLRLPRIPTFSSLNLGSLSLDFGSSRKQSETDLPDTRQSEQRSSRDLSKLSLVVPRVTRNSRSHSPAAAENGKIEQHPQFSKALKHLTGDVVILGGYRGSVLRSATPPCRQLWVPIKVGLNLRRVDLEVGLDADADENMEEHIKPSGMLKHIGPVEISRRLFKRLRNSQNCKDGKLRVWDYGYDWRLSPHLLSRQLIQFLERLPSNSLNTPADQRGATVIAHSLGGLLTRHAINCRPELVSGVIYAGTPNTCVNILGPLRNGDDVLFSSKVLTAQVNFTIRTSYALLPLDGKCFIDADTGEEYRVDFFDPETWAKYRLSPCIARPYSVDETAPPSLRESIVGSMANVLPRVTGRGNTTSKRSLRHPFSQAAPNDSSNGRSALGRKIDHVADSSMPLTTQIDHNENVEKAGKSPEVAASTAVTLSKEDAMKYLQRILPEIKKFKQELAFRPEIEQGDGYPPATVIYGKSVPTVVGAKVKGREGIKYSNAYDDLAFASGDGVVLARASQLPKGYKAAKGGVISSDRGHIALLADLEAVGKCLNSLLVAKKNAKDRTQNAKVSSR